MIMVCKFCFAELEDDVTVCPQCGKELSEETPQEPVEETVTEISEEMTEEMAEEATEQPVQKPKVWKIVLAAVGGLVLLAALVGAVLYGLGIELKLPENDVFRKDSYTMEDAKVEEKVDTVVATFGDQKLTNGELQAYYWMSVYDFLNQYGYYASMMGLDLSKPLDQLVYDEETGMTYQQAFLEDALESWRQYAMLVQSAKENGFALNEEQEKMVEAFRTDLQETARTNGYTDMQEFIDKEFFPGSSEEAYLKYNEFGFTALCYYDSLTPTRDELEAYYTAHESEFAEKGFAKENGDYYDVRHILVAIEGGTEGEDGVITYSDAEWEACRAKAQKMLDDFLGGETVNETVFADLAAKNSADPGSASSGGLYEKLTKDTNFIEGFKNWYLEEGRKAGDTGLVKNTESSTQGYHIMYFCGNGPIWEFETETAMLKERVNNVYEQAEQKWSMKVDYKKIALGHVELLAQ